MHLKLRNPIAFFDLETTGINVSADKIIEYSFLKIFPNGDVLEKNGKLNPQMPIPHETSLIHGIYDDDVKDAPTFKEVAKNLADFLKGTDLGGFAIIKFDVPMLVEEFLRVNIDFKVSNRKIIDAQKIFHLMEKRTLSAAFKFYCQKSLEDAHSAEADTKASLEVFEEQLKKYHGEEVIDNLGNKLGVIDNDMEVIHNITNSNLVDLAGRMVLNRDKVAVFNFGKHKGKPVEEVLKKEPGLFDWIMNGDFPLDTKRRLTEIKLSGFNKRQNVI